MIIKKIKFKKICLSIAILLLCFIIIFGTYLFYKCYDWNDQSYFVLNTQYGNVTIDIDKYGVPHINGESDLSAFFALGYVHAKDRLWQMEFQRHVVKGTLSEIFGKYTIEQDKYLRTWGFYQAAKNDWSYFDSNTKAIIQSYTAGVNSYLKTNHSPLELVLLFHRAEEWLIYDAYAWGKVIAWQQENIWQDKIINYLLRQKFSNEVVLSLTKPYPSSAPTTLSSNELNILNKTPINNSGRESYFKNNYANHETNQLYALINKNLKLSQVMNNKLMPGKGSNAWVVSGRLTKSGKPILANDVHIELSSPGIWYLADMKSPNLHVIGATLPGSPAVLIGHNDAIAWGITDAGVDAQDVYILPKDEKIFSRKERIRVRGSKSIEYEVLESRFGPVISSLLDGNYFTKQIAVKWTALLPGDKTIQSFLKINYAYDWPTFEEALKDFVSPPLNFLYTDKMGNIGYYLPGKIPIRENWSGRYPISDIKNNQWSGYIPFINLPHTFNPAKGYIVSANNKSIPDTYPYQLTYHWREMPYRAQRIIEGMLGQGLIDVPSTMHLQLDIKSNLWENFKKLLLTVKPLTEDAREAIMVLQQWDGEMDKNSIAPTIFAFWFERIKKIQPSFKTYLFQLPNPDFILVELQHNSRFCKLQGDNNCNDFLSNTLSLALADISSKLGDKRENWQWGNVHKAKFKGIMFGEMKLVGSLWNREVSTSGDAYSINMGAYNKDYYQIGGAMYREIIDMSDDGNIYFIITTGQSGNLFSRHYSDLLNLWNSGKYLHM